MIESRLEPVAAEEITDRAFTCGYDDCENDANWLVELRGADSKQSLPVCQSCSREHKIWVLENELFRDDVGADLLPWEPDGQVHVVCRDCPFEALVPADKRSEPFVSVHEDATGHEVAVESVDDSAELVTDGGQPTLTHGPNGLQIPEGVDLSDGVVFRARGVTTDHKPGSPDREFYPALDERHLTAEDRGVINEHLDEFEISIKPYGEEAEVYQVAVPATDGGRDHSFPSDDLWSDYRDAEIGIGDVVVDLSRGVSLQVTSVATKHAGEHSNVRSDRTAEMFGADDELVFNCVFLPDGDDAVSPPTKTYAYPESRLLRYPVEDATGRERLQREWLTNLLEELVVEADRLGEAHRESVLDVVAEAFGDNIADLAEEFAEAAGGEA